jgi:hypothetical protein
MNKKLDRIILAKIIKQIEEQHNIATRAKENIDKMMATKVVQDMCKKIKRSFDGSCDACVLQFVCFDESLGIP